MKKKITFLGALLVVASFMAATAVHGQTTTPTDTPSPSPTGSVLQAATTPTPTASVPSSAPSTGLY